MGVRFKQGEGWLIWFYFYHEKDAKRILDEGPWSFENNMLLCRLVQPGETVTAADLQWLELWVQVHYLPPGYTSPAVLEAVGKFLGQFRKIYVANTFKAFQGFFRVRVAIDVRKPLKRKMKLTKRDGSVVWVLFKYERITLFCYYCGILGHLAKHCRAALLSSLAPESYLYDESLKAGGKKALLSVGEQWIRRVDPVNVGQLAKLQSVGESSGTEDDISLALATKRKRGNKVGFNVVANETLMDDSSKNLFGAGAGFQTL
ncbi:unnamed protein product [Cuscuta campestris]|uniref:CCHC-type domain-containing protein n=1 Tax=Cuscuta campestris TaxID=132261 RepID=A0A484N9E5_9ASTE|nr:unnamed protein product [Cuscuta campestris]